MTAPDQSTPPVGSGVCRIHEGAASCDRPTGTHPRREQEDRAWLIRHPSPTPAAPSVVTSSIPSGPSRSTRDRCLRVSHRSSLPSSEMSPGADSAERASSGRMAGPGTARTLRASPAGRLVTQEKACRGSVVVSAAAPEVGPSCGVRVGPVRVDIPKRPFRQGVQVDPVAQGTTWRGRRNTTLRASRLPPRPLGNLASRWPGLVGWVVAHSSGPR